MSLRRFECIYADPPWQYDDKCHAGKRGIDYVHETMSDEEILDLGPSVSRLAADDAVLFLWVVWPKLEVAFDVFAAWGFEYKTLGFNWVKTAKHQEGANGTPRLAWGMGHWSRSNPEVCLFGKRGRPKPRSRSIHSVVYDDRDLDPWVATLADLRRRGLDLVEHPRGHDKSAKPPEVRDRIRALTNSPRLELFHRGLTPHGWWAWGNEAEGPRLVTLS